MTATDRSGHCRFAFVTNNSSANQRLEAAIAPCRTGTLQRVPGAAGERIVAFARPGKPSEIPF
jgi:hypothetical protein